MESEAQPEILDSSSKLKYISVTGTGIVLFTILLRITAASSRVSKSLGANSVSVFPLIIPIAFNLIIFEFVVSVNLFSPVTVSTSLITL